MPTLEITTRIGCPLGCSFCPQDTLSKNFSSLYKGAGRFLTIQDFKSYLSLIPSHVRIDFSGFSEPFSNPECMTMLKIASLSPNPIALYTTLQGLSHNDAISLSYLLDAGRISKFVIHLPDNHGNMPGFKLSDEYVHVLSMLGSKPSAQMMTMSKSADVDSELLSRLLKADLFDSIKDKLPRSSFIGVRRAGSLNVEKLDNSDLAPVSRWSCVISCKSTPFYDHNVLLPNGDIALCCMDYGLRHIIGNIRDGYYNVFENSAELARVRAANMGGDKDTICKNCENVICYGIDSHSQWQQV